MFGISRPDSFKGDPYGFLTNQLSHVMLGGFLPTVYCFLYDLLSDMHPNQALAFLSSVLAYLFIWEIGVQKWRGFDTALDTFFVALGASVYLFVEMDWVVDKLFVWLTLCFSLALAGAILNGRLK